MTSPRDGEGRLPGGEPANVEELQHSTNNNDKRTAAPRQCAAVTPWRRRRRAADQSVPLGDTGNVRDPWLPWRTDKPSEKQVDAAALAAEHLLELGLPPMFDVETLRALWRAGYRPLVDTLRGDQP